MNAKYNKEEKTMNRRRFLVFILILSLMLTCVIPIELKTKAATTTNVSSFAELLNAIAAASDGDTVNITKDIIITGAIALDAAAITINNGITISGNGHTLSVPVPGLNESGTYNSSPSTFRIFNIDASGKTVNINNLIIKGGMAGGVVSFNGVQTGSCVINEPGTTLRLTDVTISNSRGTIRGGGLTNFGTVYLDGCSISRNASTNGGGFENFAGGKIFAENSTFSENRSTAAAGGGGAGENRGDLYINNCTFSNNKSTELGGAINNFQNTAKAYIVNSTFTGNVAYNSDIRYRGGAIANNNGSVKVINSIFAYNYRNSGTAAVPVYTLDDMQTYAGSKIDAYYCIFHATISSSDINAIAGNNQYYGDASGTNNSLFTGGSIAKVLAPDGKALGTNTVFQPYLVKASADKCPTVPLKAGGDAYGIGKKTGFTNGSGTPVIGYYDGTSWTTLVGANAENYEVTTDQNASARANTPAVGACETSAANVYMLKVNSSTGGTVNGGTVYGDAYASGANVTLTAIPDNGMKFTGWDYVLGGSGVASTSSPYSLTVTQDITLEPVFEVDTGFTITYVGNGNDGGTTPSSQNYAGGSAILSGHGSLSKTGYVFGGWNTRDNGSGTGYVAGASYSTAVNLTLYAQWVIDPDIGAVAAVKDLVSATAYTMTQAAASDEAAVKLAIEAKIATLALDGVTTTVTKVNYTPAIAGDSGTPAGTNGTYTFTVGLFKGSVSDTTATLTMTVTATPYDTDAAALAANMASVDSAKSLLSGTTFIMSQAQATTEAAVKAAIEAKIDTLDLDGVTTAVIWDEYTEAIAGDAGAPAGTNGTYTFTVDLSKGSTPETTATDSTGTLTMTITATAYVAPPPPPPGNDSTPDVPVVQPETGIDILVNGETVKAGNIVDSVNDGKTVSTVIVDEKKLEEKLAAEGNHPTVTIPVNSASDILLGQLNGQMVKLMEQSQAILSIDTQDATYTVPAIQINIDSVSQQIGQDVQLKDITVQISIAKADADTVKIAQDTAARDHLTIIAPPVDFNISCTYNNKTIAVANFNNYVERTVAIPEGVDPDKITTGVVVDPDGTIRHMPTRITIINGRYYATINSLTNSTYSVIWNPVEFADAAKHWAKDAVNDMGSRLVITSMGNDRFAPDSEMTRAEFAAVIVRALGLMPGLGDNPFSDVKSTDCNFIMTASMYDLISGYGNSRFGPDDPITREQAMTITARAMKITGLKVELSNDEVEKLLSGFKDADRSSEYARHSIAVCVKTGIISGGSGMLDPKDFITRAQVAVIVRKLLQYSNLI